MYVSHLETTALSQRDWPLLCSHSNTMKKNQNHMDTLRTQGHDLWSCSSKQPWLNFLCSKESQNKSILESFFLKLERNNYMFVANLRGEWDVYSSGSDLIRWILRNSSAPSSSEEAANALSACSQEALNTCLRVCSPHPLTTQSHFAGTVCLNGTQRRKRTCDLTSV